MIQTEKEPVLIIEEVGNIGAGKGTQKDRLRAKLDTPDYKEQGIFFGATVMGDYFRAVAKREKWASDFRNAISQTSLELMSQGKIALDEDALLVWSMTYARHLDNGVNVLVADGMPRNINQKQELDVIFEIDRESKDKPSPMPIAVVMNLEDDLVFGRIAGRAIEAMYGGLNSPELSGLTPAEVRRKVLREYPAAVEAGVARPDDDPKKLDTRIGDYNTYTVPMIDYLAGQPVLSIDAKQHPDVIEKQMWDFIEPNLPHHAWVQEHGVFHPSHEQRHLWVPRSSRRNGQSVGRN